MAKTYIVKITEQAQEQMQEIAHYIAYTLKVGIKTSISEVN